MKRRAERHGAGALPAELSPSRHGRAVGSRHERQRQRPTATERPRHRPSVRAPRRRVCGDRRDRRRHGGGRAGCRTPPRRPVAHPGRRQDAHRLPAIRRQGRRRLAVRDQRQARPPGAGAARRPCRRRRPRDPRSDPADRGDVGPGRPSSWSGWSPACAIRRRRPSSPSGAGLGELGVGAFVLDRLLGLVGRRSLRLGRHAPRRCRTGRGGRS